MALKCKYYLKHPDKEFSSVFLRINHKPYTPFKYYLPILNIGGTIEIPTKLWDSKNQLPIKPTGKTYLKYTIDIENLRNTIKKIDSEISHIEIGASINNMPLDNDYLRVELNKKLGIISKNQTSTNEKISLVTYFEQMLEDMISGTIIQPNGTKYEKGTTNGYTTCLKCLKAFDDTLDRTTYFDDINSTWYDEYIRFLNEEQEIFDDKGELDYIKEPLALNTIGSKHIKNLKAVMARALDDEVSTSLEHKKKYFKKPKEDTFAVALSEEELQKIYNTKTLNQDEQMTKDLFLVGAYTALRYSDFSMIRPNNFKKIEIEGNEIEVLEKPTIKTKERVIIPILWDELKEILKRYNNNLPYLRISVLNKNIKRICQRAKIDRIEEYYQTKGGEECLVQMPKYELVASHTARRSAATNLIKRGFSYDRVRLITGHKSNEQLRQYIKLDKEDNAITMSKEFNRK